MLKSRIYVWLFKHKKCSFNIYNGESYYSLLEEALRANHLRTGINYMKNHQLLEDVFIAYFKYHVKPGEYFNFEFEGKSDKVRNEYICDEDRVRLLEKVNGMTRKFELRDKFVFYNLAKPFFKRKVMHLSPETDKSDFIDFALCTKNVFCKPNTGAMGVGICSFVIKTRENAEELYNKLLCQSNDWIIEETITQGNELSEWNDTSINTIRFPSFLNDGKFTVYYPKIRVGRKGQIVDNFAQGGMIAMIDSKTGQIASDAYTKGNKIYVKHPDTGKPFKGEFIPEWKELLEYAEALHRSMPQHVYVAWDFAYTTKGWDIVEANWGQLGSTQMMLKRGIKEEFYHLLGLK